MESGKSDTERRKYRRIKKRSILKVNDKIALLEDISEQGMLISVLEIPRSPEIKISAKLMKRSFILTGYIKWRSMLDDFSGLYSIGVELDDPTGEFRKMVKKFINEKQVNNGL